MIEFLNRLAELTNIGLLVLALFVASWAIVFALVLAVRSIGQAVADRNESPANRRQSEVRVTLSELTDSKSEVPA
ncbi:hypothetical protein [Agrococcus casei]|uniref:Uncharacterized protein n=1 Tax=Agrococcus casei LMG 22410 TaxID=1255656 RepID=A0A1R4GLY2_9MICO|nr:hypothetical protein [Agrococcus casei]SJM69231.1 hypothetical protein CZ674_13150 [Agrococcus casei LMG 22410]